MSERRYAHLPSADRPWAAVDVDSGPAAAYCRRLLTETLRFGLPGARRLGVARAVLARASAPRLVPVQLLAARHRRPRPDVDRIVDEVVSSWPRLAGHAPSLPAEPPQLRALALQRRNALTVLLFADAAHPLLIAKRPGDAARLEREAEALQEAELASVAPRYLGRAGEAYAQEGLRGAPPALPHVKPATAARMEWTRTLADLAVGLERLAGATAKPARPDQLREPLDLPEDDGILDPRARRAVAAADHALRALNAAVLTHGDTSPQNWLGSDRDVRLIDWEAARTTGAPGFDVWNAALACFEHGAGLARWSEKHLLAAFKTAWHESPHFREARGAARRAALAADVPEPLLDRLEIAFFARRVVVRLRETERFPTSAVLAARMLEVVCAP